ncbi:MAG: GTPase ObgE [Spirochaetota bacterium]
MQSFVDHTVIRVASGAGGAGSVSFRREKYVPKGGPDGGDGGRGGDVIVRVKSDLRTLVHLTHNRLFKAERGQPGSGRKRHGRDGKDAVIELPPGAIVQDRETGQVLFEALEDGDSEVLLQGGRGGKGNTHFASSRQQAPRFAQPGEPGAERELDVELRLIADVGFVGKPNAGKSSLLGRLTAAHPKIGAYPFTTKIPNLGVMNLDYQHLILADIPGLIEGASDGAGMGIEFLRHIARTRSLAFIVDITEEDAARAVPMLLRELKAFEPALAEKPRLIIANKIDLDEGGALLSEMVAASSGETVVGVSAITGDGIRELAGALIALGSGE